jgi:hypothetical protein
VATATTIAPLEGCTAFMQATVAGRRGGFQGSAGVVTRLSQWGGLPSRSAAKSTGLASQNVAALGLDGATPTPSGDLNIVMAASQDFSGSQSERRAVSRRLSASRTYLPITAGGRGPVTRRARGVSCASPQPHWGGGLDRAKALRYPAAQTVSAQDPVAQLGRVAQMGLILRRRSTSLLMTASADSGARGRDGGAVKADSYALGFGDQATAKPGLLLAQTPERTVAEFRFGMSAEENLHPAQAVSPLLGELAAVCGRYGIAQHLKVAHWVALGGIRAGGPRLAAARPPRRGAGVGCRFPNPPGGLSVGVNPIKRSSECASY